MRFTVARNFNFNADLNGSKCTFYILYMYSHFNLSTVKVRFGKIYSGIFFLALVNKSKQNYVRCFF